MINKLIAIPLLLVSFSGFANPPLFPGYYLDQNGDTVHCQLKFNDSKITPESIMVNVDARTITLRPAEIKGFGVYGHGDFLSAKVTYHPGSETALSIPEEYSDKTTTKDCFLQIVSRGFYSLYELTLSNRSYYFISEEKGEPQELLYRVRQRNMTVEEDTKYRNTLFDLFSKEYISYENITRINNTAYKRKDLQHLVNILNKKHPGEEYKVARNDIVQFEVFAGAIVNRFPATFYSHFSTSNKMSSSTSPSAGINLLYTLPSHFHAFAVGVSAGYNSYKTIGSASGSFSDSQSVNYHSKTEYDETFELSSKLIMLNLYGVYIINPLSKTNIFLKAGASCNISIQSQKDLVNKYSSSKTEVRNGIERGPFVFDGQDQIPIRAMYFSLNADMGISNGPHKIELAYHPAVKLNPGYAFKISMVGLHYYYAFFKR
jgi:hypothetical protein